MGAVGPTDVRAPRGWRDRAACRGVDPELFFPVGSTGPAVAEQLRAAKAVCGGCPVRAECLSFALEMLPEGIAGGLTAQERRERRCAWGGVVGVARDPVGVDGLVVASLVTGTLVPGASPVEMAHAAVAMRGKGLPVRVIATRLGVDGRQVARWLERDRAGEPLNPTGGRPGGCAGGAVA